MNTFVVRSAEVRLFIHSSQTLISLRWVAIIRSLVEFNGTMMVFAPKRYFSMSTLTS